MVDKITVIEDGNPRGKNISDDDLNQCLLDLKSWFSQNAKDVAKLIESNPGATDNEINKLSSDIKVQIPKPLQSLLKASNGNFQLHESFKTLNVNDIKETNEVNAVSGFWKNNYITFAKDVDNNYLILSADSNEVVSWNKDEGVMEQINENLPLYLEKIRNSLLKKELEYVEGCGLIENQ